MSPAGWKRLRLVLETLSIALLAGMVLFLALWWGRIPAEVPCHYGSGGQIDRWGSKGELIALPVVAAFLYVMTSGMGALTALTAGMRGRRPVDADCFLAMTKLALVGNFAFLEFHSALTTTPMPGWYNGAALGLSCLPIVGYIVCLVRFFVVQMKIDNKEI